MLAEGDLVEGVQKGGICLDDFPILTLPFGPRTELGPLPPAPSQLGLLRGPRAGPLVGVAVLLINRTQVCIQTGRCQGPAPASKWGRAWAQVGVSRGQRWGWGTVRVGGRRAASKGGP